VECPKNSSVFNCHAADSSTDQFSILKTGFQRLLRFCTEIVSVNHDMLPCGQLSGDMKKAVRHVGVLLVGVSLSIINFAAAELVIGGMS
jgi:hypothetical protein